MDYTQIFLKIFWMFYRKRVFTTIFENFDLLVGKLILNLKIDILDSYVAINYQTFKIYIFWVRFWQMQKQALAGPTIL